MMVNSIHETTISPYQWIVLREHLNRGQFTGKPHLKNGKIDGFRLRFSGENRSIDSWITIKR